MNNISIDNFLNSKNRYSGQQGSNNKNSAIPSEMGLKPNSPKGALVKSGIISSFTDLPADYYEAGKTLVKGLKGKGSDHSYGEMNSALTRLTGLSIATYLLTKRNSLLEKSMELVGFTSFFATMALWPKIFIEKPLRALTGVDIGQKYSDSYGRKKRFYQDPQYLPWDLMPQKQLDEIGEKLKVPKDIQDRDYQIKEKAKQVAIQGNTLWMMTSGIATPVGAALAANFTEKKIAPKLLSKFYVRQSRVALSNIEKETEKNIDANQFNEFIKLIPNKGSQLDEQGKKAIITVVQKRFANSDIEKPILDDFETLFKDAEKPKHLHEIVNYMKTDLFSNESLSEIQKNQKNSDAINANFLKKLQKNINSGVDNYVANIIENQNIRLSDEEKPIKTITDERMAKVKYNGGDIDRVVYSSIENTVNQVNSKVNLKSAYELKKNLYDKIDDLNSLSVNDKSLVKIAMNSFDEAVDNAQVKAAYQPVQDLITKINDSIELSDASAIQKDDLDSKKGDVFEKLRNGLDQLDRKDVKDSEIKEFKENINNAFKDTFIFDYIKNLKADDVTAGIDKCVDARLNNRNLVEPVQNLLKDLSGVFDNVKLEGEDAPKLEKLKHHIQGAKFPYVKEDERRAIVDIFAQKLNNFTSAKHYEVSEDLQKNMKNLYEIGENIMIKSKIIREKAINPIVPISDTPNSIVGNMFNEIPPKIVKALELPGKLQKSIENQSYLTIGQSQLDELMAHFENLAAPGNEKKFDRVVKNLAKALKPVAELDGKEYASTFAKQAKSVFEPYSTKLAGVGVCKTAEAIGSGEDGYILKSIEENTATKVQGLKNEFYKVFKLLELSKMSQNGVKDADKNFVEAAKLIILHGSDNAYSTKLVPYLEKYGINYDNNDNFQKIMNLIFSDMSESMKAKVEKVYSPIVGSMNKANQAAKLALGNVFNSSHPTQRIDYTPTKNICMNSLADRLMEGSEAIQGQKHWRKIVLGAGLALVGVTLLSQLTFGKDNKYNPKKVADGGNK